MRLRFICGICVLAVVLSISASRAGDGGTEFIVTLKAGQAIGQLNRENGTQTIKQIPRRSIYLIRTENDDGNNRLLQKLRRDRTVESVERNKRLKLGAESTSTNAWLDQALDFLLDGDRTRTNFYGTSVLKKYVDQPALILTQANEVRGISTGAATKVAFIDTGVDTEHAALRPWLDPGVDLVRGRSVSELDGLTQQMDMLLDQAMDMLLDKRLIFSLNQNMDYLLDDDRPNKFPSAFGHGTLVAGIIHVVAPQARLVPIKGFDAYGYTNVFTIVEAVYKSIELDVDVLNMSFSTSEASDALHTALMEAQASGIALVASAGNDGRDARDSYPAAYPTVCGVGATDFTDKLAGFSNYGRGVSVVAPGAFVVSTVPGGRYAAAWGTSFSAPIVSGAMAVLASMRGHGQSDSALVIKTADSIDHLNPGLERKLGKGRVNVRQALKVK